MFKWYCIVHHTWINVKPLTKCKLFRLKKCQSAHINNCIYHKRFKPIQLRIFDNEKIGINRRTGRTYPGSIM